MDFDTYFEDCLILEEEELKKAALEIWIQKYKNIEHYAVEHYIIPKSIKAIFNM